MLDPRLFRTELDFVVTQLAKRSFAFDAESYSALEARRKAVQVQTQELQNQRNSNAKAIGQAKAKKGEVTINVELLMFLKRWLEHHILYEDKLYGPFLLSQGVKKSWAEKSWLGKIWRGK